MCTVPYLNKAMKKDKSKSKILLRKEIKKQAEAEVVPSSSLVNLS